MKFLPEEKGYDYDYEKKYTQKQMDEALKKQAKKIRRWCLGQGEMDIDEFLREFNMRYLESKDSGTPEGFLK